MNARALVIAAMALTLAGCAAKAPETPKPDENAIRATLSAQMAKIDPAIIAKDSVGFANMFTEDGVWILPDATTFRGRAALTSAFKSFLAAYDTVAIGSATIDRLIVVNDSVAVTFAHYNSVLKPKGRHLEHHLNPCVDLWNKGADGVWRIAYEVNADGPVQPAPASH